MGYFKRIANIIAINREETSWVVGGPRVNSQQITKNTLNFMAKAWWTLVRNTFCPTTRDNVLSPVYTAVIAELMAEYDFNVAQFIAREIPDRAVGTNVILAFLCMLNLLCLEVRVPKHLYID